MIKIIKKKICLASLLFLQLACTDVTFVGFIEKKDGIGSIAGRISESLGGNFNCEFIDIIRNTSYTSPKKFNLRLPRRVTLFTFQPFLDGIRFADRIPDNSLINFAYSMLESSKIPNQWVEIFNSKFDGVIVPDEWLVDVYKDSGVKVPIFVIPLPVNFKQVNKHSNLQIKKNHIFTFGCTCAINPRKNYIKLIDAFSQAFENSKNVRLKINARTYSEPKEIANVKKRINELHLSNVLLSISNLEDDKYIEFMSSFDCFISISRGEGFAIPPKEH